MNCYSKGAASIIAIISSLSIIITGIAAASKEIKKNFQSSTTPAVTSKTDSSKTINTAIEYKTYPVVKNCATIVNSNNQFAFDLYRRYKLSDQNIFFSPHSLISAMAMAFEGAKGKTSDEIRATLHLPQDANIRMPEFLNIYQQINSKNKKYQLSAANALWAQKSFPFEQAYIKTIAAYYSGKASNVDFINETEKVRQTINT